MSTHSSEPFSDRGHDPAIAVRVEELYASHAALVRSVCGSLLRDRVETEDAVQQTFLSAQRALANGSSPRDAAAWLATIARNESLARVRSRMREPLPLETEAVGAAPDAHTSAVRHEELGGLRDALAELPVQQRDAILLREVRGFSYEEVAASLSVTTPAVESLLFRARRTLQMRLREALAASSPVAWVQPLRDLGAKLGSGLAVSTAAKVAAVGVGTAVVAGGAVVGTTVIGLGHAPARHAVPPPRHTVAAAATANPPLIWTGPVQPAAAGVVDRKTAEGEASGHESGRRTEASDVLSSSGTSEKTSEASSRSTAESGGGSSAETATTSGDSTTTTTSGESTTATSGDSSTTASSSGATTATTTTTTTSTDSSSSASSDSGSGGSISAASVSTSTDSSSSDSGD